jgi:hypothetical protein
MNNNKTPFTKEQIEEILNTYPTLTISDINIWYDKFCIGINLWRKAIGFLEEGGIDFYLFKTILKKETENSL